MFEYLKDKFRKAETDYQSLVDSIPTEDVDVPPTPERLTGLTFHYLQLYINQLSRQYHYRLMEEMGSGTIITHLDDVSWEVMRDYVRSVYLPTHPPKFIIQAV